MYSTFFACDRCEGIDCVELRYPKTQHPGKGNPWICHLCEFGTWHDQFLYQKYDPERDLVVNRISSLGLD